MEGIWKDPAAGSWELMEWNGREGLEAARELRRLEGGVGSMLPSKEGINYQYCADIMEGGVSARESVGASLSARGR